MLTAGHRPFRTDYTYDSDGDYQSLDCSVDSCCGIPDWMQGDDRWPVEDWCSRCGTPPPTMHLCAWGRKLSPLVWFSYTPHHEDIIDANDGEALNTQVRELWHMVGG